MNSSYVPVRITFTPAEDAHNPHTVFRIVLVDLETGDEVIYSGSVTEAVRMSTGKASPKHRFMASMLRAAAQYADASGA